MHGSGFEVVIEAKCEQQRGRTRDAIEFWLDALEEVVELGELTRHLLGEIAAMHVDPFHRERHQLVLEERQVQPQPAQVHAFRRALQLLQRRLLQAKLLNRSFEVSGLPSGILSSRLTR